MRKWIDLMESRLDDIPADTLKFWVNVHTGAFVFHDIDTHHTKVIATQPEDFGIDPSEVAHHPHASGDYGSFVDQFDDEVEDSDIEEIADNDDMGLFAKAFAQGWVRGGHEIDVMSYHEWNKVRHEGAIYLQAPEVRSLRRAVKLCLEKWPEVEGFMIETSDEKVTGGYTRLQGFEQIDAFVKGRLPQR